MSSLSATHFIFGSGSLWSAAIFCIARSFSRCRFLARFPSFMLSHLSFLLSYEVCNDGEILTRASLFDLWGSNWDWLCNDGVNPDTGASRLCLAPAIMPSGIPASASHIEWNTYRSRTSSRAVLRDDLPLGLTCSVGWGSAPVAQPKPQNDGGAMYEGIETGSGGAYNLRSGMPAHPSGFHRFVDRLSPERPPRGGRSTL